MKERSTADAPTPRAPDQASIPAMRPSPGYETRDIRVKPIIYTALAVVVVAAVVQVAMWLMFDAFAARESRRVASQRPLARELRRELPPEPRLQRAPLEDLLALRAWEDRMLTTYALVDREGGVVRIPIERAIELLAERGLPARKREAEQRIGERTPVPRPESEATASEPDAAAPSQTPPSPEEKAPQ